MKPKILLSVNAMREFYIDAINLSGGIAIEKYLPDGMCDCDGLVLCDGNDINPRLYGEKNTDTVNIDYARDKKEVKLIEEFVKAGKPVFGICRGIQIINAYFGGTLYQHIDNALKHQSFSDQFITHKVKAEKGSFLADIYGEEFTVNSAHHQAVKTLGKGLIVLATATGDDDTIEAIGHENGRVFAVQFQPERMCFSERRADTVDGGLLFKKFIEVCKENMEK